MAKVAPAEPSPLQRTLSNRLRRKSEHLEPLKIENDHTKNIFVLPRPVSPEETRKEGKMLFENFIGEEISKLKDIQESPDELKERLNICTHSPEGYDNPQWAKAGQELRRIADDFKKSKERKRVKQRAQKLVDQENAENVTQNMFKDLLAEFLRDEITRDDIVILFVFCADVTISLLRRRLQEGGAPGTIHLCQRFIAWSWEFILERVCTWVQNNGGWGAVFGSSMKLIGKLAMVLGIGVVGYFGVKRLLRN